MTQKMRLDRRSLQSLGLGLGRDFTDIRLLGQGAFGIVLSAEWCHRLTNEWDAPAPVGRDDFYDVGMKQSRVAIKFLADPVGYDARYWIAPSIAKELESLLKLASKSGYCTRLLEVKQVYPFGQHGLVFEHWTGSEEDPRDLQHLKRSWLGARIASRTVLDLAIQMASGLAESHSVGLVHNDIKPSNFLLRRASGNGGKRWHVKLCDFGAATLLQSGARSNAAVDQYSPAYVAPEFLRGLPRSSASDVYSFATTLLALTGLLCLDRPMPSQTPQEFAHRVLLLGQPRAEIAGRSSTAAALAKLLGSCLDEDPQSRPSARAVQSRLRKIYFDTFGTRWSPPSSASVQIAELEESFKLASESSADHWRALSLERERQSLLDQKECGPTVVGCTESLQIGASHPVRACALAQKSIALIQCWRWPLGAKAEELELLGQLLEIAFRAKELKPGARRRRKWRTSELFHRGAAEEGVLKTFFGAAFPSDWGPRHAVRRWQVPPELLRIMLFNWGELMMREIRKVGSEARALLRVWSQRQRTVVGREEFGCDFGADTIWRKEWLAAYAEGSRHFAHEPRSKSFISTGLDSFTSRRQSRGYAPEYEKELRDLCWVSQKVFARSRASEARARGRKQIRRAPDPTPEMSAPVGALVISMIDASTDSAEILETTRRLLSALGFERIVTGQRVKVMQGNSLAALHRWFMAPRIPPPPDDDF